MKIHGIDAARIFYAIVCLFAGVVIAAGALL